MKWDSIHEAYPNKYDLKNCNYKKTDNKYIDYSKFIIKKPWGHEYLIFQNKTISIWILCLKSKKYTSLHAHKYKQTYLIPITSKINLNTFEKLFNLNKKDPLLIHKKVFHQSFNPGNTSEYMMEIELPNLKNDIIRFHDYYGRKDNDFSKENKKNTENPNKKMVIDFIKSKSLVFKKEKILFIKYQKNTQLTKKEVSYLNKFNFFILVFGSCEMKSKAIRKKIPIKLLPLSYLYNFEFRFNKNSIVMFI